MILNQRKTILISIDDGGSHPGCPCGLAFAYYGAKSDTTSSVGTQNAPAVLYELRPKGVSNAEMYDAAMALIDIEAGQILPPMGSGLPVLERILGAEQAWRAADFLVVGEGFVRLIRRDRVAAYMKGRKRKARKKA